jgi:hypothetical protein
MKKLAIFFILASAVFGQNTGGGGSGGGGGAVTVSNTPLPVQGNTATGGTFAGTPFVIGAVNGSNVVGPLKYDSASQQLLIQPRNQISTTGYENAFVCNATQAGSVTASGATQILAAVASQSYKICAFRISTTPAVGISLSQGTGTNCATGGSNLSLSLIGVTNVVLEPGATAAYRGVTSNAVCITLGAAQTVNYDISYAIF